MGNLARRLKRQRQRSQRADEVPALSQLTLLAGRSLGLSDEESAEALENLGSFPTSEPSELADMVLARLLEMVEHMRARETVPSELRQACAAIELPTGRVELERRNGSGFVTRVAAMGKPALVALASVGLAVLLMLWPGAAKASERPGAEPEARIRYRRGNRRRVVRANLAAALRSVYLTRSWIRWSRSYAGSRRRSMSFRSFATGCERAPGSCKSRAKSSISSWFGDADFSTSASCPRATRTLQSVAATVRSNARHTLERRGVRKMTTQRAGVPS